MKQIHLYIFTLLLFVACTNTPDGIINTEKIVPILEDIHIVDAMLKNNPQQNDKETLAYYEHIYQKHNITKEQFDTSMAYYAKHPNLLRESYATLLENLKNRDSILKEKKKLLIDTTEIWNGEASYEVVQPMPRRIRVDLKEKLLTEAIHFFEKKSPPKIEKSVPVCLPVEFNRSYKISAEIRIFEDSQISEVAPHFVFESPDSLYVLPTQKITTDTTFKKFETSGIVTDSAVLDLAGDFFPNSKDSTKLFKHYEIRNIKITTTNLRSEEEIDSIISKK